MLTGREEVAFPAVAPVVGRHEVIEPLVRTAGPWDEVVPLGAGAETLVTVDAAAGPQVHERAPHGGPGSTGVPDVK